MKFQYMQLKFGKFMSYGYCVVPSYDAYVSYVDNLNKKSRRVGVSYITC